MTLFGRLAFCAIALMLYPAGARSQTQPNQVATLEQELGAEVDRFVETDQAAPLAPCQVLFVGSSSIVKWRGTLVADMAPMPVIERGFGGSHIEYVNRWFDEIVAPYRPRAIVFYAGENDIDSGKSVARVLVDFDEFMVRKTRTLGKTPVYFISLKPSILRLAQFPLQSQVNDAMRVRAAGRSDLHYIDVQPLATPVVPRRHVSRPFDPATGKCPRGHAGQGVSRYYFMRGRADFSATSSILMSFARS